MFCNYTEKDEGFFSKQKSYIVSRKNLNKISKEIIDRKKIKHKLRKITDNIYGNILEALVAAIYLEKGYDSSKLFVINNIIKQTKTHNTHIDYKSKIIEWAQKKEKKIKFINKKTKGPEHMKQYYIELFVNNKKVSDSWGFTKKSAEQKSSKIAYKTVN